MGRIVCYKTLRPEFVDDPYENKLFLREARITGALQHPNTAPVYEVGYDSRGHTTSMKLVQGTTLRETLDKIKRGVLKWDLQKLVDVVIEVAEALNYAHTHRIAHCDIKPENIVLGDFGEIFLLAGVSQRYSMKRRKPLRTTIRLPHAGLSKPRLSICRPSRLLIMVRLTNEQISTV